MSMATDHPVEPTEADLDHSVDVSTIYLLKKSLINYTRAGRCLGGKLLA
jgi:hypothetical protein